MTTYMTIEQVAAIGGWSVETLRTWRKRSTGPRAFRVGKRLLYATDDVAAWLEAARDADRSGRVA
jgi:DNA-binding transcriptional MerR regulator